MSEITYLSGFGNHHKSEALNGALPDTNTPQKCPYGLYAEQLQGTSFTAFPREKNLRRYVYIICSFKMIRNAIFYELLTFYIFKSIYNNLKQFLII